MPVDDDVTFTKKSFSWMIIKKTGAVLQEGNLHCCRFSLSGCSSEFFDRRNCFSGVLKNDSCKLGARQSEGLDKGAVV